MSKVIVVTGGTSGFGHAICKRMSQNGDVVVASARSLDELEKTQEELHIDGIKADVTNQSDWIRLHKYVMEQYGHIDVLINNAGGGIAYKPFADQTVEEIRSSIDLNLTGAILGCKAFATEMAKAGNGLIINVASVCAKHEWANYSVYAAAKAGLLSFSKSLYVELRDKGVRVTCLLPAASDTNFAKACGKPEKAGVKLDLTAESVAQAVQNIIEMPNKVEVEEMTVWGLNQEVNSL
jgi:short-subunit dehydrogenase